MREVLRIQPLLTIEEEVLDMGLDIVEQVVRDVNKGKVGNEVLEFVKGVILEYFYSVLLLQLAMAGTLG